MTSLKDKLRARLDDRKTPYPAGTKRTYMIGGLIALAIPTFGISLAYAYGEYDVPWGWIYIFITPWHLVTLVGLYYVTMAYLIKEKRKRK